MMIKATEKDRNRLLAYCQKEPNLNIFIIGDIEHHGFDSEFQDVWYQTSADGAGADGAIADEASANGAGDMEAVALRYHDNLILYSYSGEFDMNAIEDIMKAHPVNVISGKKSVLDPIFAKLSLTFGRRDMNFCELADPTKLLPVSTEVQIARLEDAQSISDAYGLIEEFSGLYSGDPNQRYVQIASRIESGEGVHMFISENGRIVSHGNTTAETSVSAMIGGVFSLPDSRRRGHASRVVSNLCHHLLDRRKTACLFYDKPENGAFFESLGFKQIDQWTILGRK